MLHIFNSLTKRKEKFVPITPDVVKMYVCGMTVYDFCHLGHGRVMVFFDIVKKWLQVLGYSVTYVRNITDIDDKIIKRACERGISFQKLTAEFIEEMRADCKYLGVEDPDHEPKATDHIPEMIGIIEILIKKGYAYHVKNGDVYFSVKKFETYGKLSGKSLEDLQAGSRVLIDEKKDFPLDFVLWKKAKLDEPFWNSPWGKGRPGWHIECSVMSKKTLGTHFDIHGGGQDLQFPHHENEIAQSECAHGAEFVNYWMHNGFVRIADQKMSKSLNNFFTIRELLKKYDPEVLRYFILRAHYRSPLNYSNEHIEDAHQSLSRLYTAAKHSSNRVNIDWNCQFAKRFREAMNDDFNTPLAISVLFELAGEVNRTKSKIMADQLNAIAGLIGLLGRPPTDFFQSTGNSDDLSPSDIEREISARDLARKNKNYILADQIRNTLWQKGIELEDSAEGTIWRKKQ
ncbi:MAG: cysteine--tRNA ligase [Proteobacteria bacterium]|nr:cysteine--tRNA ligase [Pseudomonadota bacterium]